MSLYQPVGDTLALTALAYQLYRKGYQVAKHAPDEFRTLLEELNVFKRTIWQIEKSLKDSNEHLGEDIITICTNVLVKDFEPLVAKYEKLAFAERGQHWIRRFQFAADQDAIKAAYSRLDRAQSALQAWLTLDTRDACVQYFESIKKELANQRRQNSLTFSPLERVTTGASLDLAPARSIEQRVDSVLGSDDNSSKSFPIPFNLGALAASRPPNHMSPKLSSLGPRDPLNAFASQDTRGGAQISLSPRQTSLSLHTAADAQESERSSEHIPSSQRASLSVLRGSFQNNEGSMLPSDSVSDISGLGESLASGLTDNKSSVIDDKFFKQFIRECVPRPELEDVFAKSAKEDVHSATDPDTWTSKAVWWTIKSRKVWDILNDQRASLSSSALASTEWMTENITLEQTIVDLMKADYILHRIVLERLQIGNQITWASMRRLQDLSTAIRHGFVRESRGASLETSVLLKQRTSLVELFVQPLEQEDAMPAALDTMDAGTRFLEVDEDIAGSQGERVLYRTFCNAQVGDKGHARKSPNAPYLLVLWMQKYGADFEVSLLNQYGSLSLNLSMTREEARKYHEELAAHGSDLRLDFPGQKAIIKFLSNANAEDFIARPREFFEQVKDRYPRHDEFLVFRAGLHSSQGPRRVRQRTRSEDDTGQPSRPCEISLYNHVPLHLWKMTRRLVLCSVPSKRSTPQPFSKSIWLPLDHVRVSVARREVKLLWSDCGHLEKKNLGDYREEYGYVYKANEPNQELHLVFKSAEIAAEFANHILLPFETGLHLDGQFRNAKTIHSLRTVKTETRIVVLRDLNAPENSGYFALVSTHRSPNSPSHSTIHFAYADNDIKVDIIASQAELSRLRQPRYLSGYTNLTSIEPSTSLDKLSACKTIRNVGCSKVFRFDSFEELRMFLLAMTDWTIVFSRRAKNIQFGNHRLRPGQSTGAGEVQLWAQQRAVPWSSSFVVRMAIRVDSKSGGPRYYTTSLAGFGDLDQPKTTRVTVKPTQEPLQQGSLLEMRHIRASIDRQDTDVETQSQAESQQSKHTKLTIDFADVQHARELLGVAERLLMPGWGQTAPPMMKELR